MKKKLLLVLFSCFLTLGIMVTSASATWYNTTIIMVGGTHTGTRVQITDNNGSFSKRWFTLAGNNKTEILATILTALSLGKRIRVSLSTPDSEYSELTGCYLIN